MNVKNLLYTGVLLVLGFYSCKVSEKQVKSSESTELTSVTEDTVVVEEEAEVEVKLYKGERTRHFKLVHTKLEVSFDWEKQYLFGDALLILEPYFYDQSNIVLDAKGFEIHTVEKVIGEKFEKLMYAYDGQKLDIDLAEVYKKGQQINLHIKYTSKPNEGEFATDLLNDKKGLYFINPLGNEEAKPQQIWTHGETDSNSRWFPTLDEPNQKSTQEIYITVQEKFETLSNGTLVYSKTNADSTRTDYWKMDEPHAPYLFMLAVGEFAITEDEWNGKKVDYYVEPDFAEYADDVFGNTPEMISYFSDILNYPYPWDKYSQVVVRDFISGAMENTTASVFMEDLNVNSRELIDYNWDDIISHELIHQWFGDLVTCESWANLPLNESFATYGEVLWKNHKYGKEEAAYHLFEELDTYLIEAENKNEDLIRFYYENPDEMFDSHSYAKGGLILHLLRNYVGDEAFFKSLEYYLKANAFGKAEVHQLRLAFEHVTGEDLNWFFNQWFLASGHPKLRIEQGLDTVTNMFTVKVWQDQDIDLFPVFKLPLTLDMWENGQKVEYLVEIDKPYQEFEFEDVVDPDLVLMDSEYILVGEIEHPKTPEQYRFQFEHYVGNVRARMEALNYFLDNVSDPISQEIIELALSDKFWVIRQDALEVFEDDTSEFFIRNEKSIEEMAIEDMHPLVRAEAISVLANKERAKYVDIFKLNLYDSSYSVAGNALYAYLQSGTDDVDSVLQYFSKEDNFNIASSIADYYIQKKDYDKYAWFANKLHKYSSGDLWYFIKLFGMYLINAPEEQVKKGIMELEFIAKNHSQYYNRLSAYQSLGLFADYEGVPEILEQIKESEIDPRLKEYYD